MAIISVGIMEIMDERETQKITNQDGKEQLRPKL